MSSIRYFKEYPHIIENSGDFKQGESISEELSFAGDVKKEYLAEMLKNLQELSWQRVNVYFSTYFSHEKIVVKRSWMFDNGTDIVKHLSNFFKNQ